MTCLRHLLLAFILVISTLGQAEEWKGQYLTLEHHQSRPNTWMLWRKKANIEKVPASVKAKIATDSKYWLYINEQLVVFEGGLKRGPAPNSSYYDEVEIAPYLKSGENLIAVLTWYFGLNGFSHVSSGTAGLLFEARAEGLDICSDKSWRGNIS